MSRQTHSEMRRAIHDLGDATLDTEISLATRFAFEFEDEDTRTWLEELKREKLRRSSCDCPGRCIPGVCPDLAIS